MKSKRCRKYGIINERSNPFEDIIYAGEIVYNYIDEDNDREVVVIRDETGCLHETYQEFLITTCEKADELVNLLKNRLNNMANHLEAIDASISSNYTFFNKNKNNTNPNFEELIKASNTFMKAIKKRNKLISESDILTFSLTNIANVIDNL